MSTTPQDPQGPVLPEKPRSSKRALWITIAVVVVAAVVAAVLLVPQWLKGGESAAGGERTTVKLGTTDASQGHWPVLQEILAEEGIDLEIVSFDSYETPNPALADGEIDLNAFQHIDYLSSHNVATGDDLTVVGPTLIVPLPIYSAKFDSVDDLPEGGRVTIPNDATNQARALKVLQAAGLITLDESAAVPTPADITDAKIEVEAVDASQTAPSLNDPQIVASVVNNNFATDAGILDQALFWVDPSEPESWPYINIIAARSGEEDNPVFQAVWKAYHDPRVTKIIVEESGDTAIIVEEPTDQVREWLVEVEDAKRDAE